MNKKEKIMLVIIFILVIGLIIMIRLYFQARISLKQGIEYIATKQERTIELNKKITELKKENESLKNDLEQYQNSTKILSQSYGIDYHIEKDIFYTDKDDIKIISADDAAKIAEKEAKNEKYQNKSFESEFSARGKNSNGILSATLLDGTMTIKIKEEWKKADYNNKTLIWEIRLFDNNDPLNSLFVYVNAVNGIILGAQELSD